MMQMPPISAEALTRKLSGTHLTAGRFRFSVARFLIALILLFVSFPFLQDIHHGPFIESSIGTLVMCLGVLAVGAGRRTLVLAIILAIPAVLGNWINHFLPELYPVEAVYAARLVFLVFVVIRLMLFILRAPRVNSEVLCAGVSIYLLLGLVWAMAYIILGNLEPSAFSFSVAPNAGHIMDRPTALYFSFITLSTVGYGDIVPVSNTARVLAMTEATCGTLFVGVLIARLVSLYSSEKTSSEKNNAI